jgi:hypothetical protein
MQRLLCCLALLLALNGITPAADDTPAPVIIPGGVCDTAGKVGYLSKPRGGVVAVDLEKGEVLWENSDANRPLAISGNRLAVLAPEKGKANVLRVLILDTAARGKRLVESEPIKLPEWAVVGTGLDHHQMGKVFVARARMFKDSVAVEWLARSRYYGGAAPPPQLLKAATKDASGAATINLESGKVEAKLHDKIVLPSGPALTDVAKLPKEVQDVAKREMWQIGIVVGPRAYGLMVKNKRPAAFGGAQSSLVQAVDAKTGKVLWERAFEEQMILPPPP